ncbi:NDP-hexose 2,3-dehydratase family protein [Roseococcus pinisoli]|uniref:NDP-hexose 2,3-dehydratase family protein n=1 Tax=Roseococcus pinisoli TaxID=2835040 RepID=A0ABS5QAQ2_9PROT|nr:NDP-hexose 2,3-dehydratase family protein [Roseococcus pinisoli]MBS7810781.1 NDP-hexose 2,3-dehydratase family protein [Roseococcus pinisoli]
MPDLQHSLLAWIAEVVERDAGQVEEIALSQSSAWSLREGALRHETGRYFNVVGLEWVKAGEIRQAPFIEQREVGTLGLIARPGRSGLDFLMHAKAEPGNVGGVQLAPTCQATASNADRVHGGTPPPFSREFLGAKEGILADSLQSEQGSRFLGKRNRNVLLLAPDWEDDPGPLHRWISFAVLRDLLAQDFLVNTDARSVLCTSDWPTLAGRAPFPGEDRFSRELCASFHAPVRSGVLEEVFSALERARAASPAPRPVPVDAMAGFGFDLESQPVMSDGAVAVRQIRVRSRTREVAEWDQPILDLAAPQLLDLPCRRQEGLLLFGYRPCWEPGLLAGAELAPGSAGTLDGTVRLEVRQSDEGGRFHRDIATYRVLDLGTAEPEEGMLWLTLAEVHALMPRGVFNNEARSATSLLLSLA